MSKSVDNLIADVGARIHSLLYDEVIEHTIVVMRELGAGLNQLSNLVRSTENISAEQRERLTAILLPLTSESIREALHKNELPITNGIIRAKNRILTTLGVTLPESHHEIDPRAFPNYNW
jgi:hypothetical protein